MEKEVDKNWPAWRFGPDDKSDVFEKAADVPKGWVDHPSKVGKATAESKPKPPTEGKATTAPTAPKKADAAPVNPLAEARKAYMEATGKKGVSPKWDVDTINA